MIQSSFRFIERFVILIPGIIIAFLSVKDIFPYVHHRVPFAFAILLTYALAAYLLIPFLIRIIRSVWPTKHPPLYSVTPDGFASDPLNIGIIGNRRELITAMEKAGWYMADQITLTSVTRQIMSTFFNRPYTRAPVGNLYLFGRTQDIAFELPVKGKWHSRHHVRFWATSFTQSSLPDTNQIDWYSHHPSRQTANQIWVGAASLDAGLSLIRHNFQISHMIDPDTDRERSYIVEQLKAAHVVKRTKTITLGRAYRLANRVWRGYLRTDGKMIIINLDRKRRPN